MENKKEGKGLVPVIVILTILLVCALGSTAYFYLKSNENTGKETVVTDKADKNDNTEKTVVENGFYSSKSLNTTNQTYTLLGSSSNGGINLAFDADKKKATVTLSACTINLTYNLGWVTANENACDVREKEHRGDITFDQEVSEFMFGGFGQEASNETMLFLMKDGTVEYIPIAKAYKAKSPEEIKSTYGTIPEVKNIIKLYQVSAGSYVTVLAQKADGSFYDLNESLSSIKAWS